MNREEAIGLLKSGPDGVNNWNELDEDVCKAVSLEGADLSRANLLGANLSGANLSGANLSSAHLGGANLIGADLRGANLSMANLSFADLREANLREANLIDANLSDAKLPEANLNDANVNRAILISANLIDANLRRANLTEANLNRANFISANLSGANLSGANLSDANLSDANLIEANLIRANLSRADLSDANLRGAMLQDANLIRVDLHAANLNSAHFASTSISNVDLSTTTGLETTGHEGPSSIGLDTIQKSGGKIPGAFLRGCGLSPWEVEFANLYSDSLDPAIASDIFTSKILPSLCGDAIRIGGVFISYSWDDQALAETLRMHLYDAGASVWLDIHDAVAGDLQKQPGRALRTQDAVVVILSESSTKCDWVEHELELANKKEEQEGRDVLCAVALDESWKDRVDGDVLWRRLKKKAVLDFSAWETEEFAEQFDKLERGLRLDYQRK